MLEFWIRNGMIPHRRRMLRPTITFQIVLIATCTLNQCLYAAYDLMDFRPHKIFVVD
jgi:hypothetical protein